MALIYTLPKRYTKLSSPLSDDDADDDLMDEVRLTRSRIRQRSRVMGYYPRTFVPSYSSYFDDKYSFLLNSYQPTLDYLRRKTQDISARINDLCSSSRYQPSILPHIYSPSLGEINRISRAEAARTEQNYLHSHVMARSPFRFARTANTARVFRRIHPDDDDIIECEKHHQHKRDDDLGWHARSDYLQFTKRRTFDTGDDEISGDLKRALRGQSPNTIADLLLADSEKRIQQGRKKQKEYVQKAIRALHSDISDRSVSRDRDTYVPPFRPRRYRY